MTAKQLTVGIAYDLREDIAGVVSAMGASTNDRPDDLLEEYDSFSTVQAIAGALEGLGYRPRPLGGGKKLVQALLEDPPDLVFNFAEGFGTRSREAHVPAVLEMLRIPFTHSDPLALAVSLDKGITKRLVASMGVPTPRFAVVKDVVEAEKLELRYPLFAKPVAEGSSMGIRYSSKVNTPAELKAELSRQLTGYDQPVLVEEYVAGPEFTVGILGTGAQARPIGVMEIAPKQVSAEDFVYSLEVKRSWEDQVRYIVPAERPAAMLRDLESVALAAYRALDCRDVGRVDLRVGADGKASFIEVNPVPGLDPVKSDIVILAKGMGMSYPELIGGIVASARKRYGI